MQVRWFVVLLVLVLAACGETEAPMRGEQGPAGDPGPPGPAGPAGASGTIIRVVDGECRQACIMACEQNERILNAYAINPGGAFTFDTENKATFRPPRQGVAVKVVLACVQK
jgi:hypothetical protein